jgi:hypothetical protein
MSFNQFTNLDFNDLRTQIKDYLRANSNFTDFDFEGSNFSILIDTLAYNSYITAYNTNMAVNESFIDSATLRENIISLARNIGYVPRSKRAARALVTFSVNVSGIQAKSVKLSAGVVATGAIQGGNYIFSIPDDITVTPNSNGIATFENIEIYEGTLLKKSFIVDDSQVDAKYILPNLGIDTTTIRVSVRSTAVETYEQYANIFEVNSISRLYLIQEIEDEKYQLLFGDNVLGKKPENGSTIDATYIVTNGIDGNNASNFTFSGNLTYQQAGGEVQITSGISLITTIQASENGDNIESIDNIKYLAPRVYSSQYRAVTSEDYISLIPFLYSNVESVSAYGGEELDPPQYGKVFITIKPKNGEFLSEVSKNQIKENLKKYTVAGIKQELLDLKYLYVEYDTTVSYNPSLISSEDGLYSRILKTIENYSKTSDINSFGGRFKYSKFVSLIDKVDTGITSNITTIKMRRNLTPAYNVLANYEICYANKFHSDLEGFNVKSSAFKIDGVDGDVYLTDTPLSNGSKTGVIKYFIMENNVLKFINNNAGTVNYEKGEIILYPIVITSTSLENKIEIEVIPDSNDILSRENIYIVLDNTDVSKLLLIKDTLSSGSNRSGLSYVPPSSFTNNKKYTR